MSVAVYFMKPGKKKIENSNINQEGNPHSKKTKNKLFMVSNLPDQTPIHPCKEFEMR